VTSTITAILGILYTLSLHGAVTRIYFDAKNDSERNQNTGTIWVTMILLATGMAALLDRLGEYIFPVFLREVSFVPYIRLAIWTAFFNIFSLFPLVLFQIQEHAGFYVLTSVIGTLLTTGLIIGFVVFSGQGAYGYLLGMLLAGVLLVIPYIVLTLRNVRIVLKKDVLKAALVYSLPLIPHGLASWILELSDRLILERYVPLEELGLYSLGYQFGLIMTMVATAINNAWVPFLFKADAQQGEAVKPHLARMVTYYTLILSWIALGLALLAKDAILLLTTPSFYGAHRVIPWIIGGLLLSGLYYIPVNYLFLKSKTGWIPLVTILSGAVNVGLNLWLTPFYGIMAAAWSTFLSYGVMLVSTWLLAQQMYFFPYEYKRLGQILLAAIGVFLVGNALSFSSLIVDIIVRGTVWLVFPIVLATLGFFTIKEREKIQLVIRQKLKNVFLKV